MRFVNNLITALMVCIITIVCSCNETTVPTDQIFNQNPDWLIFAPDYIDFEGITFNIDNNYLKIKYKTRFENHIHYFKHVDSLAQLEMWRIDKVSDYKKIYRKISDAYPASDFNDMISITYNKITREIKFDYKPEYE